MALFIDTNVFVYAHDSDAGAKHATARKLLTDLWLTTDKPVISTQVISELHVNLVRKLKLAPVEAVDLAAAYLDAWNVVDVDAALVHDAWEIQLRWQLSYWDAQMVAAALRSGCTEIWTEDLNDGQDYGGAKAVNPFKTI